MAADTDSEMRNVGESTLNIANYRKVVQTYLNLHLYKAALFWADKVVALSNGDPRDVYWLAQCMFSLKEYHRAAHLIRSRGLDKTYILCNYLAVRCLLEAKDLAEATKVLNVVDVDGFMHNNSASNLNATNMNDSMLDDSPKLHIQSSVLLLKGRVLEAMDNLGLAAECYKKALQTDVHCYEAFDALIKHQMLTATEEKALLDSLPLAQQCAPDEAQMLTLLYESKMKKYHTLCPKSIKLNASGAVETKPSSMIINDSTDAEQTSDGNVSNTVANIVCRLRDSLDLVVSEAERLYYNCEYKKCTHLTEVVLKKDPYHSGCLPIHISCQVELKLSNKLFTLAHKLVNLYPDLPISWFAVGCYYYVIGKSDYARRYLAKATNLDRLFGPAWLAYGHSFAIENEHDQAMAAYFKASQLMKGCHLPILYIGLECGLTNNVRLADKFFIQALSISPFDPFVMHEMGVIAFQNLDFKSAEVHFKDALQRVRKNYDALLANKWEPLLNNLGHTCRKLKKYDEALEYHHQALVLAPQSASTYSAIGYVKALMGDVHEAVDWFHRALSLRRDDTFSTTMLSYVIEQLVDDSPPYPDAPENIPEFHVYAVKPEASKANESTVSRGTATDADTVSMEEMSITAPVGGEMSMSFEVDLTDTSGFMKE